MSAAQGIVGGASPSNPMEKGACEFFVGGPDPCVMFQASTDDGKKWNRSRVPVTEFSGRAWVAADPSKKAHFSVMVLNRDSTQLQVFQTTDAGKTWSAPTVVMEDATKKHYKPWMAYSRQGVLALMWRTHQPAPGQSVPATPGGFGEGPTFPYNVWAAVSRDGGATFSEPLKVSGADSPAPQGGVFGNAADDYSSVAADGDYVYVGWADWRPGERQGFFSAIKLDEFTFKH
jgi:hypothetical protein